MIIVNGLCNLLMLLSALAMVFVGIIAGEDDILVAGAVIFSGALLVHAITAQARSILPNGALT